MTLQAIRNDEEHQQALNKVLKMMDVDFPPGSIEEKQFLDLVSVIEHYEDVHYPMNSAASAKND